MEKLPSSTRLRYQKNDKSDNLLEKKDEGLKNIETTRKKQSKQSVDSVVCIFVILLSTFVILHRSETISTDVLFSFKVNQY